MDRNFNLAETSNLLIQALERELGNNCVIRLSLDVQLPAELQGDFDELGKSIKHICEFLVQHLVNGLVDIEIVKAGQHNGHITIGVDVRGSDAMLDAEAEQRWVSEDLLNWLNLMPHKASFSFSNGHYIFSFKAKFGNVGSAEYGVDTNEIKILLVEDNEMNALVFASFLEAWEIEVTVVGNGKDAVSKLKEQRFDLVLMDIHMPVMNGIQATKTIREFNVDLPIVVLTASSLEGDVDQALSAGANDFLLKPVSSGQLKGIVAKYLSQFR